MPHACPSAPTFLKQSERKLVSPEVKHGYRYHP